ncbi:hypothetical protein AMTR_s00028p00206870 [Amborella trichopoda]|uniref:Glucose-methanol-choline oxidoreductase N-terminal domain-containing protein n=1 Tax=Amborella trichopoda TaxID=13333 RepID=W1PKV9_AMBTC|nr:hypothetical protein AMTR_s00028p00206870 [Amborella trichopoda]
MLRPRGEVILSAGAIDSPQLLMLGGIGPNHSLIRWGIPVAHHLPAVGNAMHDNPRNALSFVCPVCLPLSLTTNVFPEAASNFLPFTPRSCSSFLSPRYSSIPLNIACDMAKIPAPCRAVEGVRLVARVLRTNAMDRFKFPKQHFGEREFWYLDDVRFPANVSNDDAVGEFC